MYDTELELILNEKKDLGAERKKNKKKIRKNSKERPIIPNSNRIKLSNINLNENIPLSLNKKRICDKEKDDLNKLENKMSKRTIRQMMERIHINKKYNYSLLNKNEIKKRKLRIFGDMSSSSEISQNLFKNYYPCVLPSYYPTQIKSQIILTQINKITNNFESMRKLKENEKTNKLTPFERKQLEKLKLFNNQNEKQNINNNIIPNHLRDYAENNGEWIEENEYYDEIEKSEENEYDDEDSNNENNSRNTYPEERSDSENEDSYENNRDDYNDYIDDYNDEDS